MRRTSEKTRLPIEELPFLGTTWYTRGPAYWVRRVLASVLMFLGLAMAAVITVSLIGVVLTSDTASLVKP